jgi:hypothetical protein
MLFDVGRVAAYSAHGVAVVAVVEENGGVGVEACELFFGAGGLAIVVYAGTDGKVLEFGAYDGAEGYCCDDWILLVSLGGGEGAGGTYHWSQGL